MRITRKSERRSGSYIRLSIISSSYVGSLLLNCYTRLAIVIATALGAAQRPIAIET